MKKKKKTSQKKRISLFRTFGLGHDRYYFIENVSMLIASGMDMLNALNAASKDIKSKNMRLIIAGIGKDIESGSPLWKALDNARIFAGHTISLIKIGEESGKLSDNLRVISLQQGKEREFRSKIQSAVMYPVFVLALTVVIGFGIAWFILPRLATVFTHLKLELPLITKILIATGTFLGDHGTIVIPVSIVILIIFVYFLFFFRKTKIIGQTILFWIPGIKRVIQEVEIARFGYLLGTLLQAGLPVTQALNSLADATIFPHYKKFYIYLANSIEEGNSFQKSFDAYPKLNKLIPVPIQQLIVTGEKSGNLSDMLLKISNTYEAKTEITTKNMSVILEPILLVIVWLGVVAVALAVILPIYSLIGGLNAGPQNNTQQNEVVVVSDEQVDEVPIEDVEPQKEDTELESLGPKVPAKIEIIQTLEVIPTGFGYLNVRSGPSLSGEIIGKVDPGDVLKYTEEENGWYKIVFQEENSGWIFGKYVKILTQDEISN